MGRLFRNPLPVNAENSTIMKKLLSTIVIGLIGVTTALGQVSGTNAFLMGNFAQIGIDGPGGFEGANTTAGTVPGLNMRGGGTLHGFVADPGMTGWVNFDGDFFTPGSPENGWGFQIGATQASNNCAYTNQIPGSITSWQNNSGCIEVQWDGDYVGSGYDLHWTLVYKLKETDTYYTTTVTVTNNGAAGITDLYWYRNVDPDNNQPLSFDFTTQNTIVSQPTPSCEKALVSGTQSTPWPSYLGFGAIGPNFRVSHGGFSNRSATDIWNGTGLNSAVGSTVFMDQAISLANRIYSLPAGASEQFEFVVIMDASQADAALTQLFYFDYVGGTGLPFSECTPDIDTVYTCAGQPVTLSIEGPALGDFNWTWSPGTGLSTTTGITTDASPMTTTSYTVTGVPINPCYTASIVKTIVVIAQVCCPMTTTSAFTDETCLGDNDGTITLTSSMGYAPITYDIGFGPTNTTGIFTGLPPGTYNYTVTDDSLCVNTGTVTIAPGPDCCPMTISQTSVEETCIGTCDGSITITTALSVSPITYSIDGGATTQATGSFTGLCAGTYPIEVIDATGCTVLDTVILNDGPPYAIATIDPAGPFCEDAPAYTMTAAQTGGTWAGTGITNAATGTFDPATAGPGTYTITYTMGGACGDVDTEDVIVNPLPVISFTADITQGCEPLTVTFTNTGATGNCVWNFGDGGSSTNCDPTYTYSNAGIYDVTLTVTDANGCVNSMVMPAFINVYGLPGADFTFGPQPTTMMYPEINFTDGSTGNPVQWEWDFAGLGTSSAQHPTFSFDEVGSYDVELVVTTAGGCTDTIVYTIFIGDEWLIYVPNAFTPNGDGINDMFIPYVNAVDAAHYEFYVFDRWGELLYKSETPGLGWDGNYKGQIVTNDVYVWRLVARDETFGETHEYTGHVTVVK